MESSHQSQPTRPQDSAASASDSMTADLNPAPETRITLSLTECRRILIRNWDLLSEKTKVHLQSLGVYPIASDIPDPSAAELPQNRNI